MPLSKRALEHGEDTLSLSIGVLLKQQGLKLALAESCTGGLVASRVTSVAGASAYFEGACLTYSNTAKVKLIGVPESDLLKYGAVSPEVASAMATGVKKVLSTDIALSITGIAGPEGGSPNKKVGLVYIALSYKGETQVTQFLFSGDRQSIQTQAAESALCLLKDEITP